MESTYKETLRKHIQALKKSYNNIILILNDDVDLDELKDEKRKVYAEGIAKSAETAELLLSKIKSKEDELKEAQTPAEQKLEEVSEEENSTALSGHLK